MERPQLGHYSVKGTYDKTVRVIPPFKSTQKVILWVDNQATELTPSQARRIAHGLIISAERAEYPNAVAGAEDLNGTE